MWKVTNIAKPEQNIKIAVAKDNTSTLGVILKPNQFCICDSRMTSSLDAQEKRGFISIDRNFQNNLKLNLCEAYDQRDVDLARKQAVDCELPTHGRADGLGFKGQRSN
ncbi:MAG: hypothetical protein KatS3mg035_1144 [Bacteroidia bacterium]|nr:MAG: hypothetical protein KatS3mg035_1144 [Bacteroidia bacterium]